VQVEGKERDQILQSLYGVGPKKAIGYLPLYTLREFLQIDPREMADQVALRGLTTAIFNVEQCRIKSGAIYFYDRDELQKLLNSSAGSLTQCGLPIDPDHFLKEIAATWYEPEHPVYPIISAAFGE